MEAIDEAEVTTILVLVTLLVLLLVAGITIAFFTINRQKVRQLVSLTQTRLDYEKELRQVELEVREQLMTYISRELHDHVGHHITYLRLALETQKINVPEYEQVFEVLNQYVTEASEQVRMLSRSLNSEYIGLMKLDKSIDFEIKRLNAVGRFKIYKKGNYQKGGLDRNQELVLFRIFQEVINNAIKHSRANSLEVYLGTQPNFLFEVKDDGIGFDLKQILASTKASGLKNILRRSEMANLDCKILTAKDKGCLFRIERKTENSEI